MADFSFTSDADLQRLNAQVLEEPEEFEHWEKLVRAAEAQEGGLNRNSSPSAIAATRDTFDRLLACFPLFFGYWKKYADFEFSIAGTEAAEMVYERGVASIGTSVDLWANYCGFKTETNHDADIIRELFERAAENVGLDFLAHPFWDKYIEFEERLEQQDRIFQILNRLIHVPMHQYARYFEKYRGMAHHRPIEELAPAEIVAAIREVVEREAAPKRGSEADLERELRLRLDGFHLEIFQRTQIETTKRWTFEQEIKRPYYHVTELDEPQLINWRKYLDFEEVEGDYTRARFLYERCLVTAANYDEFWFRYARWMLGQDKAEEVRNIYQRASCVFVPIIRPAIRLAYARFEESVGQVDIANDIHEAILINLPSHQDTILSMANLHRRQHGVDASIQLLKKYIDTLDSTVQTRGALVAEWARLVSESKGDVEGARQIYQSEQQWYLDCNAFWLAWFQFEIKQPQSKGRSERVRGVYNAIRQKTQLPLHIIKDVTTQYLVYLEEHGDKTAMKEAVELDMEVFGPYVVQKRASEKLAIHGKEGAAQKLMAAENGHPGVGVNEDDTRRGSNAYPKNY